jgi:hypothetical protein
MTVGVTTTKKPNDLPSWQQQIDWLTPAELEALRREAAETSVYAGKVFAHLRPKPAEKPGTDGGT